MEIQKLDRMFNMKSRVYQFSNTIEIDTQLDQWRIVVTNWTEREKKIINLSKKPYKRVCLLHKNKKGRKNKYHLQAWKGSIYAAYDSIYNHKRWMPIIFKRQTSNI